MKNLCLMLFVGITISVNAQHQYNRFNIGSSPLIANPALTGTAEHGMFHANLQRILSIFTISDLSYQTYLPKIKSGIGATLYHFQAYENRNTAFGLSYSYQAKVSSRFNLSAGVSSQFHHSNAFNWNPTIDRNYIGFNAGLLLYSDKLFVSASVNDIYLFTSNPSLTGLVGRKFSWHKIEITPSFGYSIWEKYHNLTLRLNIAYKQILLMAGSEAKQYIFGVGYFNSYVGLNYMFDFSTSPLSNDILPNHRFSIQVKLPKSIERKTKTFDFSLF